MLLSSHFSPPPSVFPPISPIHTQFFLVLPSTHHVSFISPQPTLLLKLCDLLNKLRKKNKGCNSGKNIIPAVPWKEVVRFGILCLYSSLCCGGLTTGFFVYMTETLSSGENRMNLEEIHLIIAICFSGDGVQLFYFVLFLSFFFTPASIHSTSVKTYR